eukprot:Rhum_TRINITY_DN10257_c0_g1::Rhum_TRINITY_DN10257_c0_g1_i1::g.37566::m.37566
MPAQVEDAGRKRNRCLHVVSKAGQWQDADTAAVKECCPPDMSIVVVDRRWSSEVELQITNSAFVLLLVNLKKTGRFTVLDPDFEKALQTPGGQYEVATDRLESFLRMLEQSAEECQAS